MKLSKYEQEILDAYERGQLKKVKNHKAEVRKARLYAKETLKRLRKDKRMNIRMSSEDIEGLKREAKKEGIPYQTLVSSILHKYVEERRPKYGQKR